MKCCVKGCSLDTFENEDKCIFHCEKSIDNGWILDNTIQENSKQNISYLYYKWDNQKVKLFWEELKEYTQIAYEDDLTSIIKQNFSKSYHGKGFGFRESFFVFNFIVPPIFKDVNIFVSDKKFGHYTFTDCIFKDNFILKRNSKNDESDYSPIEFISSVFEKDLRYLGLSSEFDIISLDKCTIKKSIKIDGKYDDIKISNTDVSELLEIGSIFSSKIKLENISLSNLNLNNLKLSKYNTLEKLYFNNLIIKRNFTVNSLKIKEWYLNNSSINSLYFYNIGFIDDSNIYFEELKIKDFKVESLQHNTKNIQFNHVFLENSFDVEKANFSNLTFNDFDISRARKRLDKVSFIDSILNSIKWGNISKIESTKDIFRQLKFVNDKQANYIDANNFYSMEMKKHKEDLRNYSWFSNYWQEKFIFALNEKISNFGQSWFMVILWIMMVNLTVFSIYKLFKFDFVLSDLLVSFIILIVSFILGLGIKEKFSNKKLSLYTLPYIFLIGAIICCLYYFQIGSAKELIQFISFKLNENDTSEYLIFWMINKSIFGFLVYHLVVSLRRQTRR